MRKDNARLELRLSREDKARIEKAAKKCGLSVKKYVLRCCKGKEVRAKPPDEFWQILNHLYAYCENMDEEERMQLAELILKLQEAF